MWQIIGAGAIGCLWAANLLEIGQEIRLISKNKTDISTLNYKNLQGIKKFYACTQDTQLIEDSGPILVCVKAPQVKQSLQSRLAYISENQVIILMHNGMGSAEQVAELLPNNPIICATTSNASLLNSPLNITQTGLGISYLGPFNEQARSHANLSQILNQALNDTFWSEDIEQKLWLKLIINIAINPLTAIFQINNGELSQKQFQVKIETMLDEAMPLLKQLNLPFNKIDLFNTVNHVINATAKNFSSMNRDIHFKRATENDYINGYLIKKASQFNIEMPLITSLYEQVKVLESH